MAGEAEGAGGSRAILVALAVTIVVGGVMGALAMLVTDALSDVANDTAASLSRSGGIGTRAFFQSLRQQDWGTRMSIIWGCVSGGGVGYLVYRRLNRRPKHGGASSSY